MTLQLFTSKYSLTSYYYELSHHHSELAQTPTPHPIPRSLHIYIEESEQQDPDDPAQDGARGYLSPLILNHASAHCRCAAPSSSLQPQPRRITSEPGTADSSSSGPRWQIRHPSPGAASAGKGGAPSISMTRASVGRGIGGEAPAAVGAAATASRRMCRSGSGQRVRVGPRPFRTEATATDGRAGGRSGGGKGRAVYEGEGRVDAAGWVGQASMRAREAPSHQPTTRTGGWCPTARAGTSLFFFFFSKKKEFKTLGRHETAGEPKGRDANGERMPADARVGISSVLTVSAGLPNPYGAGICAATGAKNTDTSSGRGVSSSFGSSY